MKKTLRTILGTIILGSMFAMTLGFSTIETVQAAENEKGSVSVWAEATEETTPNMATITLSVETSDKDISKVTEANKKAANDSIAAVKKLIDTQKGESLKTLAFNVSPEYRYKDGTRIFVQYNARNSYEVKIKDISKLGKIISAALANGANVVSNLTYSLDTNEEACNKLIKQAGSLAKTKAETAAGALGTSIAGVKYANIQCSTNSYNQPRYNMALKSAGNAMAMEDSMEAGSGIPAESGTIKFRATVDASFFVK